MHTNSGVNVLDPNRSLDYCAHTRQASICDTIQIRDIGTLVIASYSFVL